MMTKPELGQSFGSFEVVCVSCGDKIRSDRDENSCGLCLKCFQQMLGDHLRAQPRARASEFVSER